MNDALFCSNDGKHGTLYTSLQFFTHKPDGRSPQALFFSSQRRANSSLSDEIFGRGKSGEMEWQDWRNPGQVA